MSAAKQMRSPAIDLEEFERRLRAPEPVRRSDDPLAELARLVGSNDPFRGMAPPQPALPQTDAYRLPEPVALTADTAPQVLRNVAEQMRHPQDFSNQQFSGQDFSAHDAGAQSSANSQNSIEHAPQGWDAPTVTAQSAQQWAEPEQPAYAAREIAPPPPPTELYAEEPRRAGLSRKGMLYAGSAVAVLVVGLGATLATGGKIGGSVPTISASREPVKVKPEGETAAPAQREVRTISILDKAASGKPVPAKAISREEQPVDLSQVQAQPRGQRVAESDLSQMINLTSAEVGKPVANVAVRSAGAPQQAGYFPEPKKVKTVAVRPDGSVVVEPPAAASAPRVPSVPALASANPSPAPVARPAAPQQPARAQNQAAAPEKATARANRVAPEEADAAPVASTRAPVRTAAPERAAATPAPQRVAAVAPATSATPAASAATATATGGFAVQLAAPGSEAEAKSTVLRLRQKFGAELGSRSPSVRPATVGDKTVYRVRIGGLSREDATALCQKLQGKGGACFVAKN